MATKTKKTTTKKPKTEEQLDLFDYQPEKAKVIAKVAHEYKAIVIVGRKTLAEEIRLKNKIKELVKEAKLKPLPNGVIKFVCDGIPISITPRDEVIRIGEKKAKKKKQ